MVLNHFFSAVVDSYMYVVYAAMESFGMTSPHVAPTVNIIQSNDYAH